MQYKEGQRLQGSDGNVYVVRGGVPTPESPNGMPAGAVAIGGPDPLAPGKVRLQDLQIQNLIKNLNKGDAPPKPNLPTGWEIGPDGRARLIPGLTPPNRAAKLSPKERTVAITGYTDAAALERIADNLERQYQVGPGATKGIAGLQDYLPTAANKTFDDTAFQARGMVKRALGFTGGEGNTIGEITLNYGPYLPEAGDRDEQIVNKIRALRQLAGDSRNRSVAVLGGAPDANGNITPVGGPEQPPQGAPMIGGFKDELPDTSGLFRMTSEQETQFNAYLKRNAGKLTPEGMSSAYEALTGYGLDPERSAALIQYIGKNGVPGSVGVDYSKTDAPTPEQQAIIDDRLGKFDATGAGVVGLGDSAMIGTLDELSAGGDAIYQSLSGEGSFSSLYDRNLGIERGFQNSLRERNPYATLAGNVAGSAVGMTGINALLRASRFAPVATNAGGVGGDMLYGAGYGAGATDGDRLVGAATGATAAGAGNIAGRGIVSGIGRGARGVSDPAVRYLNQRDIPMTPGQIVGQGGMFGRGARGVENALESVPFLGNAIKLRKEEGLQGFNREAFGDALAPINQRAGGVGQDGIAEAQDLVSGAYGDALQGVSLRADMPFVQQAGSAIRAGRRVPEFGPDVDYLARENLGPMFGPGRTLDGESFQSSLQDIASTNADFRKAGNVRGRNAANSMGDLRQSYFDLANRQAPGANEGLAAANAANRNVSILGDSVTTSVNSQAGSGVFTPAQLGRAAVNNTKKFGGKRQAAAGNVPFRDLTEAGQAVLPSVVPNSGTADRAWASMILPAALGGSAIGAESLDAPVPLVATLGLLSALSTKKGSKLFQSAALDRPDWAREIGEALLRHRRSAGMFGSASALPLIGN